MSWINGIRGLVSSEELAKDVTGAEALLERHQVSYGRSAVPRSNDPANRCPVMIFFFFLLSAPLRSTALRLMQELAPSRPLNTLDSSCWLVGIMPVLK